MFEGSSTQRPPIVVRCRACGTEIVTTYSSAIVDNVSCPNNFKCGTPGKNKFTNAFVDFRLSGRQVTRVGPIEGAFTACLFRCEVCTYEWFSKPTNLIHSHSGCPRCTNHTRLSNEKIDELLESREILRLGSVGRDNKQKILFRCNKCDHEWSANPNNVTRGTGCPACCSPKNEKYVAEGIEEITQVQPHTHKTYYIGMHLGFEKIRDKIYVDFYFEWQGAQYIVEYNGNQHYEPFRYHRTQKVAIPEKIFKEQQIRDACLREYCSVRGIRLIEIDARVIFGKKKILEFLQKELLKNDGQ